MMKQTMALIAVFSLLLLVAGCDTKKAETQQRGGYLGGTQGIIGVFEPFGGEEEGVYAIYETETFPLSVALKNKGEYELKPNDVTVKLLGPAREEIQGLSSWELKNRQTIEKISELVPDGGEEVISFATDAKFKTDITGYTDRQWFANVEYKYLTEIVIPEVCLKEDIQDPRVCEIREDKAFFVSGAPITTEAVKEDTAGKGVVALKILVKNVAGGRVTKVSEDFGIRDILSFRIDDPAWECKSGGKDNEARLIDGKTEIVCKLKDPLPADAISTKQVKVTLEYKYRELIQETLRLKESIE